MNMRLPTLFRERGKGIFPITRLQLWGGILLGVAFTCVFYYLLFLTRESLRLLTVWVEYEVWRLTDWEAWFYNLFIAYLSAILAMATVIGFWVKGNCGRGIRGTSMLTDVRVLNFYFLSWFGKVVLVYAVMFSFNGGQYVLNLYPGYAFVFVLLLIVLFLQCWVTIRRIYRREATIWMLKAAALVSVLAFGLSFVNPVDYRNIDRIIDARNPNMKYSVQLPEVSWYVEDGNRSHVDVYIVRQADSTAVVINNGNVDWMDIRVEIDKDKTLFPEWEIKETWLHIDRRVGVKDVWRLHEILRESGSKRNRYVVIPEEREYDVRYYRGLLLPALYARRPDILPEKCTTLRVLDEEKSIVSGEVVSNKQVVINLSKCIRKNVDYCFVLEVCGQQRFQEYVLGWSMVLQAINLQRNAYARKVYGVKFDELYDERQDSVAKRIPIRILEKIVQD